jgi:hypothetical protein
MLSGENYGFWGQCKRNYDETPVANEHMVNHSKGSIIQIQETDRPTCHALNKTQPTKFHSLQAVTSWNGNNYQNVHILGHLPTLFQLHRLFGFVMRQGYDNEYVRICK